MFHWHNQFKVQVTGLVIVKTPLFLRLRSLYVPIVNEMFMVCCCLVNAESGVSCLVSDFQATFSRKFQLMFIAIIRGVKKVAGENFINLMTSTGRIDAYK